MASNRLRRLALLSIAAAIVTIAMKSFASLRTGSVGLFSDALESIINLVAAATAYFSLWYASRPADHNHTYGHDKIEFFASGLEGALILVAGIGTAVYAIDRIINPNQLVKLDLGASLAFIATGINFAVARVLLKSGRETRSIVLEADGHHLMTDVWTSLAVVSGLILVRFTQFQLIDPLLAILVSLIILRTGFRLIRRSFNGLMDHAISSAMTDIIRSSIRDALPPNTDFHALRTRQAGSKIFIEFHLLVSGSSSVRDAHKLAHDVEDHLHKSTPGMDVIIHIEPIEDPASWESPKLEQLGEPNCPGVDSK